MYEFAPISKAILLYQKAYERFLKIRGKPREIALGMAVGLFVGMTPYMGFQTAIAVFIAALFKWNKISAAMGVWVSNPLTAPLIYSITYYAGTIVMGGAAKYTPPEELSLTLIIQMLKKSPDIFWVLTVGGVLVGLPLAIAGYYLSYSALLKYQADLKKKLRKTKELHIFKKGKVLLTKSKHAKNPHPDN
jgi:uncharacterized protein (DUF2062 family)